MSSHSSSPRGFEVAVLYCATCGDTAEGIPDGTWANGLPEGWVAVVVRRYEPRDGQMSIAMPRRTIYYCSEAHLPTTLLPSEVE